MAALKPAIDLGLTASRLVANSNMAARGGALIASGAAVISDAAQRFRRRNRPEPPSGSLDDPLVYVSNEPDHPGVRGETSSIMQSRGDYQPPSTDISNQLYRPGPNGLQPLSETEMIRHYHPNVRQYDQQVLAGQLGRTKRVNTNLQGGQPPVGVEERKGDEPPPDIRGQGDVDANKGDSGDVEDDVEDDINQRSNLRSVNTSSRRHVALVDQFGGGQNPNVPDGGIGERDVDQGQARDIMRFIREHFPSVDPTTAKRIAKCIIVLGIVKEIPFSQISDFIKIYGGAIWEWLAGGGGGTDPPGSHDPDPHSKVSKDSVMFHPLPPHCQRRIFYRDGRVVSITICADERGVRYYEQ